MPQGDLFEAPPAITGSLPPVSGNTSAARHASWTGAQCVVEVWAERQSAYLQLLENSGALTDHEAAALLKCGLSSINSIRNGLVKDHGVNIVSDGFDAIQLPGLRPTRRTRWTVKK